MDEKKMNRKVRYTRRVLKESLLELMKDKLISKITVKDICELADINRATFYSHYKDRYDLLSSIESEALSWAGTMIQALTEQTDENEKFKLLEGILQYFADNRKQIQVLMSEQGDITFQKKLLTLIYTECGFSPMDPSEMNSGSTEYYFTFVINGSIGMLQKWLKDGLSIPVHEMARIIYDMAFRIR